MAPSGTGKPYSIIALERKIYGKNYNNILPEMSASDRG